MFLLVFIFRGEPKPEEIFLLVKLNEVSVHQVCTESSVVGVKEAKDLVAKELIIAIDQQCDLLLRAVASDSQEDTLEVVFFISVPHEDNRPQPISLGEELQHCLRLRGGVPISDVDN